MDPAATVQADLVWTAFLGVVSLGLSVAVGVIGWFLKGTITRAETTAQDLERIKGELRGKVAVLEERVNGIGRVEASISAMKSELVTQIHNFREELRGEITDLRQDLRAVRNPQRRGSDG